jgi:hypothetical protein
MCAQPTSGILHTGLGTMDISRQVLPGKNATASSENGVWSSRKDLGGMVCRARPRDPGGETAPGNMAMVHKIMHGKGQLDNSCWFEKAADCQRTTRNSADPLNHKKVLASQYKIR